MDKNGHLTHAALGALQRGALNPAERLAVSEHLNDCDDCLASYLQALEQQPLLAPMAPVQPGVAAKLHQQRRGKQRGKTIALAALLVAGLWMLVMLLVPTRQKPQEIETGSHVHETLFVGAPPETITLSLP